MVFATGVDKGGPSPVNTTTSGRRQYDVRHVAVIDVGTTSYRRRLLIGPAAGRCGAASGRRRLMTSGRRRVPTSARRRRVYWTLQKIAPSPGGTWAATKKWFHGPTRVHTPNTFGLHCAESVPQRHLRYAHIKPPVSTYLYSILI